MQQERPVRLAGGTLGPERHICALFNNRDEEHRVLRSFFTEGLDRGEKAVHVVGPEQRHHHVARLREAGIDVEQAIARGQLDVLAWTDVYLRGDRFDQHAMLAFVEELLRAGVASGHPQQLLGHMEWSLLDKPGARLAVDIMRTHTLVIVGGILQQNPFFVPPDQFLLELRERGAARH
jgi:hypothetical protein